MASTWLGDHQGRPSAPLIRWVDQLSKYGALTNILPLRDTIVIAPGPRGEHLIDSRSKKKVIGKIWGSPLTIGPPGHKNPRYATEAN